MHITALSRKNSRDNAGQREAIRAKKHAAEKRSRTKEKGGEGGGGHGIGSELHLLYLDSAELNTSRYVPSHNSRQAAGIKVSGRLPRNASSRDCPTIRRITYMHTHVRVFLFSLTRRAQDPLRVRRPGRSPPRRRRGRGSVSPPRTRAIRHRSEGRSSSPRRLGNLRWSPAGRTQNQDHEGYPSRGEHTQGTRAHLALRRRAAVRYRRARWTAREERRKRSRRGREER